MSPVFPVELALYAAACALYFAPLLSPPAVAAPLAGRVGVLARRVLMVAFAVHAADIGYHCVRGAHPFADTREAISFIAWLTAGAYLVSTVRQPLPLAGALIVPVTLVLDLAARLGPEVAPSHATTALATAHIALATAGVAAFAVAAGDAVVYLFAERHLKRRYNRPSTASGPLPPLETIDNLSRRSIQIGFALFTAAMILGAALLLRHAAPGGTHPLLRPQYALSVVAWAIYAGLLVLRVTSGWRGRRAALLTIGGFAASLGVVAIYYVRGLLGGGG